MHATLKCEKDEKNITIFSFIEQEKMEEDTIAIQKQLQKLDPKLYIHLIMIFFFNVKVQIAKADFNCVEIFSQENVNNFLRENLSLLKD